MPKTLRKKTIDSRLEIAETLSRVENRDPRTLKSLSSFFHKDSLKRTICFTGPAGVGKSTLVAQLLSRLSHDLRVAWLAFDPSSPKSGGSLLGDRIRSSELSLSESVFIRSLATRSSSAFQKSVRDLEIYLESLFDWVFVETAGTGQTQVEVTRLAALTVLILQPETGDEIQWLKSGIRDLADLVIIHKADLPGADEIAKDLTDFGIPESRIFKVSSQTGLGHPELWSFLMDHHHRLDWPARRNELHRELAKQLFFEAAFQKLHKAFQKKALMLTKNPYSGLR